MRVHLPKLPSYLLLIALPHPLSQGMFEWWLKTPVADTLQGHNTLLDSHIEGRLGAVKGV